MPGENASLSLLSIISLLSFFTFLLISKYSFINMGNVVFQIQISKNINNLPITRNYIYN